MKIITVKDLDFKYKKMLFENLDLEVNQGTWLTLLGPNGSGKSTLIKILTGIIKTDNYIIIDGLLLRDNIYDVRRKIGVVFDNPNNTFVAETVIDELAFALENMNYSKTKIKDCIKEISEFLNIKDILKKNPHDLDSNAKCLVSLGSILIMKPKVLIIDELLDKIDYSDYLQVVEILNKLNKEGLTIINITHDIEQSLLGNEVALIKDKKIIKDKTLKILEQESLLKSIGLEQPFMLQLSNKLKYYDLVKEPILDVEKMVDYLWK